MPKCDFSKVAKQHLWTAASGYGIKKYETTYIWNMNINLINADISSNQFLIYTIY